MRDIKFRGKNIITNKWVYGHYMEQPNDFEEEGGYLKPTGIGSFISDCNLLGRDLFAVDSETIGQYTGLKDNNGKEIYESDILRTTEENGIDTFIDTFKIVWDIEKGGFMIEYLNCDEYYNLEEMPECVVVGNIYES